MSDTIELFQGTRVENVQSIISCGFVGSAKGRLGPGGYFTDNFHAAQVISAHRGNGTNTVVLKVQVKLPKCVKLDTMHIAEAFDGREQKWAKEGGYMAATGTHPSWLGLAPFNEWVILNPACCKVTEVHMLNGALPHGLNAPGVKLCIRGTVSVGGNLVCDIVFG